MACLVQKDFADIAITCSDTAVEDPLILRNFIRLILGYVEADVYK